MNESPRQRRYWLRWLGYGAVALVVLLAVGGLFLVRYLRSEVRAEHIQALINDALAPATDGLYTAGVGGIEWGNVGFSLRVTELSLMLVRERLAEMDAAGTTPPILFQLQHASVDVTGIDLWRLLRRDGFRALSLTIDEPLIQISGLEELLARPARPVAGGETTAVASEVAGPPAAPTVPERGTNVSGPLPALEIWSLRVNDASLESYRRAQTDSERIEDTFEMFERFDHVDIALDGVDLATPEQHRLLFADDLSIEIAEYYYLWPDGLHEERHGPIRLSTSDGLLELENFSYKPTFGRRERLAADGSAPDAFDIEINSIRLEGLDFAEILESSEFQVGRFAIGTATLELRRDPPGLGSARAAPAPPEGAGQLTRAITEVRPGALLTEALTALPVIRVGSLEVDRIDAAVYVDRDASGWLDEEQPLHVLENLQVQLTGYASGPDIEFDPSRPFFADSGRTSIGRAVTTVADGSHQIEIMGWSSSASEQRLAFDSLRVVPLGDRRATAATGVEPKDQLNLTAGPVVLSGIDYGSLLEDVDIEVDELRMEQLRIEVTGSEIDVPASQRVEARAPAEVIAEAVLGLPNIRVNRVLLQDASYELLIDRTDEGWLDESFHRARISGLDMNFDSLMHVEGEGYDPARPLLSQAADVTIDEVEIGLGDGFQHLVAADVELSSVSSEARIGSVRVEPVTADLDRLRAKVREDGSVARLTSDQILLQGRVLPQFLESGEIVLERLEIASPAVELYGFDEAPGVEDLEVVEADSNAGTLSQTLDALPPIRVGRVAIQDASYDRYVEDEAYDWAELPDPLESIGDLDLTLEGFDTRGSSRRLMLSDRVALSVNSLHLALGDSGNTLRLGQFDLASDSSTLSIDDALFSTAGRGGNNTYSIDTLELDNVPYGRAFRALIEPSDAGTPVIAAMVDKNTVLRIGGIRGELDNGERLIEIGGIQGSAADGALRVESVALRPTLPDADPSTAETELFRDETMFRAEEVEMQGVDFERLAREGALEASLLRLQEPTVSIIRSTLADEAPAPAPAAPAAAATPAESIARAVADFPVVALDRLRIDRIAFAERRTLEGNPVRSFDEIQLEIDGLDLRPDRDPAAAEGVLFAEDIRLRMPEQRTWLDNTAYEVEVGPIALSTGEGSLSLGRAHYLPPSTAEQFLQRTSVIEGDRIQVDVGDLRVEQIDLAALLRDEGLRIGRVRIADWQLWVLSDKKKPRNPNPSPPGQPHEAVQAMGLRFGIDQVDLVNGGVRYSERHREGEEPGHIWWDRISATITNVSNDATRMSRETPLVMQLSARMLDQAFLEIDWRIPLLEPGPTMSISAQISPFEATRLSSILVPIEGVRVSDGVFDQVWFDIGFSDVRSDGTFNGLYHDLKIQLEDRNTGGRSLKQRLLSFAANIILPSNNRDKDGKPAKFGTVDYEIPPTKPFFGILWDAIKTGVMDLAM